MPYADIDKQREYGRIWAANKRRRLRSEWIEDNGPCQGCGGDEQLEIHHKDPSQKEFNASSLWSRSPEIRDAELAKCTVLCKACHLKYTIPYLSEYFSRVKPANTSLTDKQASEIKYLLTCGVKLRDIADKYGCPVHTIKDISRGKTYKSCPPEAPFTTEIQESFNFV